MVYFEVIDAIHKRMGEIGMLYKDMAKVLEMDRRTLSMKLNHRASALKGDQLLQALHEVGLDIQIVYREEQENDTAGD